MSRSTSFPPAKRPRIDKSSSPFLSSSGDLTAMDIAPISLGNGNPGRASVHGLGGWRKNGRPVPHDILLLIARYLGDMQDEGDVQARLTLAAMMRVSSDGFDAAARALYHSITITRDSFSNMLGGNDIEHSKLFEHPITFPTRDSVVRKLGLFQWVKHMHIEELPNEQAVSDLLEAFHVACSQPASAVSCQQVLRGRLFPRLEGVSFSPKVFLNHHSAPPLGPEYKGRMHRFLTLLRRESAPTHMCLELPTPGDIAVYKRRHRGAERPCPPPEPINPDLMAVGGGPAVAPSAHENSLVHADQAEWPTTLARAWDIKTISVHNVRFTGSIYRTIVPLQCERLRLFGVDSPCSATCDDGTCSHCDLRWSRAATLVQGLCKSPANFKVVEIANIGAGYPLTCRCVDKYANAIAALKESMHSRALGATWTLETPHCAVAAACVCCGAHVAQTGDTGDGVDTGSLTPDPYCTDMHPWERSFRPEPVAGLLLGMPAVGVPAPHGPVNLAALVPGWIPPAGLAPGAHPVFDENHDDNDEQEDEPVEEEEGEAYPALAFAHTHFGSHIPHTPFHHQTQPTATQVQQGVALNLQALQAAASVWAQAADAWEEAAGAWEEHLHEQGAAVQPDLDETAPDHEE
ncbi:hypothetical protein CC85DRAFT_284185 [Cutaneotrichosporon oleaginosum]|uniref:Uncharacterized protein n=1 Tax=Cutaneotrichosporon oleaginosum TaxID=879819 RepID=A0A0J0XS64_9TREE|nr:uncharacterized protein CC85DRAFT_284185 [Cutaneotrichosporon oleaginosum]KLT43905.1 hypothetical protein CC85DRAFT_284185 [Cutaneotrichosporon oleaginosum]TXT06356.1 hypothetical protein COLE_05687 [Cutaneotrichosporon oleaginosum]